MQTWKITLTYDGTPFHGWQIQPDLSTVQGVLSAAIGHITGETVLPQGSGRTDTGVHALGQVASFALECPIPETNLHRALNRALPSSIRVLTLEAVPPEFHARYSVTHKSYEYRIFPGASSAAPCSPMLAPYVWDCPLPLEFPRLQQAAGFVAGTHDFTSFAAVDPDRSTREAEDEDRQPSNVRTIYASNWELKDGLYVYRVTGSGFLHHMVRNLVGTFVEMGAGRRAAEAIPEILRLRDRAAAGPTAPARGLFLVEVAY